VPELAKERTLLAKTVGLLEQRKEDDAALKKQLGKERRENERLRLALAFARKGTRVVRVDNTSALRKTVADLRRQLDARPHSVEAAVRPVRLELVQSERALRETKRLLEAARNRCVRLHVKLHHQRNVYG
jgi:small-conductance mechanosensitive channel